MVQKGLARRRKSYTASLPIKQRKVSLHFKRLDAGACSGQRQVMLGSGLGQAAFFGCQQEQPQVIEVKMHAAMLL